MADPIDYYFDFSSPYGVQHTAWMLVSESVTQFF